METIEGGMESMLSLWDEHKQKPATLDLKDGDKVCIEYEVINAKLGVVAPISPHVMVVRFGGLLTYREPEKEQIQANEDFKEKTEAKKEVKKPNLKIAKKEKK